MPRLNRGVSDSVEKPGGTVTHTYYLAFVNKQAKFSTPKLMVRSDADAIFVRDEQFPVKQKEKM